MTFLTASRAAQIGAVALLTCTAIAPAHALDSFWHGVVSGVWEQGINGGGASNWYSKAPPNGDPTAVPNGIANFRNGAMRLSVIVNGTTAIRTMRFPAGTAKYGFRINKQLTLQGTGVENSSTSLHRFTIPKGHVIFDGTATAGFAEYVTSGVAADLGNLTFRQTSRAGDALITNGAYGVTTFQNTSNAGFADILNQRNGATVFKDKPIGGSATIENSPGGELDFLDVTARHNITLKSIKNAGVILMPEMRVTTTGTFTMVGAASRLDIEVNPVASSRILARGKATLAGTLHVAVKGTFPASRLRYTIVHSDTERAGVFASVTVAGLPNTHKFDIDYVGKDVFLTIEPK